MKQIHEVLRVGFEPGTHGLEVQHPNHSATLPPCNQTSGGPGFTWAIRSWKYGDKLFDFCRWLFLNPLSLNIIIQILLTGFHRFYWLLIGRICLNIKAIHLWGSLAKFSWPVCHKTLMCWGEIWCSSLLGKISSVGDVFERLKFPRPVDLIFIEILQRK